MSRAGGTSSQGRPSAASRPGQAAANRDQPASAVTASAAAMITATVSSATGVPASRPVLASEAASGVRSQLTWPRCDQASTSSGRRATTATVTVASQRRASWRPSWRPCWRCSTSRVVPCAAMSSRPKMLASPSPIRLTAYQRAHRPAPSSRKRAKQ